MQSFNIKIEDTFVEEFLALLASHKDKVQVERDINLNHDTYFYERQKELSEIRSEIKSGKRSLICFEDFEHETEKFEKKLDLKYAN